MSFFHTKKLQVVGQRLRTGATIAAIAALVLTVVVPDADHHGVFTAARPASHTIGSGQGETGPLNAAGESMHHCLVCAGSSQRMMASVDPALFLAHLLASITIPPNSDRHSFEIDLHSSGKRGPPL